MATIRRFIVLGLGTFGSALARRLHQNGCRVTGVDRNRERVEELKEILYEAVIGDVTDRDTLEQLAINEAEAVLIALGEDMTRSLLSALHAKELKATRIIVKGVTPEHGKLLKHLGVERVIFPEQEMALQLADGITWPNVLDLLKIDSDYSVMEMAVPDQFVGKTLQGIDLRRQYGVWLVGVKDVLMSNLEMFPDPEFKFGQDQVLLVIGKQSALQKLRDLDPA